jgi:phosphate transport system substrate-binding protein
VIREEGSGTRDCLDTALAAISGFNTDKFNTYSTQASTGAMVLQVQSVAGAIGYVNLGSMSDLDTSKVSVISLNGVAPSPETTVDGTYALSRNLVLITKGERSGAVAFFLNWILSEQGQKMVADFGFVPVV